MRVLRSRRLFVPVAIGEIYFDVESLYDDDAFIGLNITYRQDLSWIELYQTYSDDPSVDVAIASWSPPEADSKYSAEHAGDKRNAPFVLVRSRYCCAQHCTDYLDGG